MHSRTGFVVVLALLTGGSAEAQPKLRLNGQVVDADTQAPLACRIYIQGADGTWHFAKSASPSGSAVEYRKERGATSVEMHTTLSAHPYTAELPAGRYTVTVERGKEYLTDTRTVELRDGPVQVRTLLRRWINLSARGWYSGETHVHRGLDELPNAMLADDRDVKPSNLLLSRPFQNTKVEPRSRNCLRI